MSKMDRLDILNISKTEKELDLEERIAKNQALEKELMKDSIEHEMTIWRLKHEARKEVWTSRLTFMKSMFKDTLDFMSGQWLNILVNCLVPTAMSLLCALMFNSVKLLFYGDPDPTNTYYVEETDTLKVHKDLYRVVWDKWGPGDEILSETLPIEKAMSIRYKWQKANTDKSFLLIASSKPCWIVKKRERWEDPIVSDCFISFKEADLEKERLEKLIK